MQARLQRVRDRALNAAQPHNCPQLQAGPVAEDNDKGWSGYVVCADARDLANTVILVSPSLVDSRYIDDVDDCDNV